MDSTEGLKRGDVVVNTGAPISVPVGPETLGRIINVIGEPIDDRGVVKQKRNGQFIDRLLNLQIKQLKLKCWLQVSRL